MYKYLFWVREKENKKEMTTVNYRLVMTYKYICIYTAQYIAANSHYPYFVLVFLGKAAFCPIPRHGDKVSRH